MSIIQLVIFLSSITIRISYIFIVLSNTNHVYDIYLNIYVYYLLISIFIQAFFIVYRYSNNKSKKILLLFYPVDKNDISLYYILSVIEIIIYLTKGCIFLSTLKFICIILVTIYRIKSQ